MLGVLISLALKATLLGSEVTGIGASAYHVVLSANDRQASIPNPDGLAVFITNARGRSCWDATVDLENQCVGPTGGILVPRRDVKFQPDEFVDPSIEVGALVYRTENGRTRFAVNDRDNDGAFTGNTGGFEFDVFLAPREATELAGVDWISNHLLPLATAEARNGFADLEPLRKLVGGARIVSLGEATHGTREFFQLKHRLLEFLATEMGFSIFSIEASMPEAYRLNDYVLNGVGDPVALIRGMYFWTWTTEEVLDMVKWMREFNASGRGRLQFTGFDMQTPTVAAQNVREFAAKYDRPLLPELDRVHREVVRRYAGPPIDPNAYGQARASFPAFATAGKRVRYSGYIRTQDVNHGHAALWWRVDGPGGMLFYDNLLETGSRGTTDWQQYEINVTVPANATGISFGVMHAGDGTAWFDNLSVEINGVAYVDAGLDFDFETPELRGFTFSGQGYLLSPDTAVVQRGNGSLRSDNQILGDAPLVTGSSGIVETMKSRREAYRALGVTDPDIEWAIQNARLVYQQIAARVSPVGIRDQFMAENVKWIAGQNPNARMVLWAHNFHVAKGGYVYPSMGSYLLPPNFGDEMVVFGFAFNRGGFQAIDADTRLLREFTLNAAREGTMNYLLAATGVPLFALDLRTTTRTGPGSLLRQILPTRYIGATFQTRGGDSYFTRVDSAWAHDVILFVDSTTRARPIR